MDTNNSHQEGNSFAVRPNIGGALGYDITTEKQRIAVGIEEIKKELSEKFRKKYANAQIFPEAIVAMHPGVVDYLLSFNLVAVYDNIARLANLDVKGRNILPKIVWQIAQSKNWNSVDQILEQVLPSGNPAHAQVVDLLRREILNKIQVISEKPVVRKIVEDEIAEKKQVMLPLSTALAKYPKLAEQNITTNQLNLRYSTAPVRPSIKNWITDFHDAMGAVKHSPIDRGNFLFHSENAKKLSSADRQKLATILKSLDEQMPIVIDESLQAVVFEADTREERINPEQKVASDASVGKQQIDRVEDFFSVAESKPPIGTENFHAEERSSEKVEDKIEKKYFQEPVKNISPSFKSPNNVSFSSAQKLPTETSKPSFINSQQKPAQEEVIVPKLVHEAVSPIMKEQIVQPKEMISNVQPNKPVASVQNGKSIQNNPTQQKFLAKKPASPYHISPNRNDYRDSYNDDAPKINGNVVDLR